MPKSPPAPAAKSGERIAKVLARAGLCSRRDAERWIAEGRVTVNGAVLDSPALNIGPADLVVVDGKPLPAAEPTRLWRYHKPEGLVTTRRDPEGRPTVFDALPADLPRVISVGRLDLNSEGLLLLTNDGALARHLELPATGWLRRYRVRVYGVPSPERLAALAKGTEIDGVRYGPVEAALERQQGSNAWLTVALREGRNREVRKLMEHLGLPVSRLIRVSYGPFQLGTLGPGEVEEVRAKILRDQVGPVLTGHPGPSGKAVEGAAAEMPSWKRRQRDRQDRERQDQDRQDRARPGQAGTAPTVSSAKPPAKSAAQPRPKAASTEAPKAGPKAPSKTPSRAPSKAPPRMGADAHRRRPQ